MPLDPTVDISRRAWLSCPNCDQGAQCLRCQAGRDCDRHWQYLLSNRARQVYLQCPNCTHIWDIDTRKIA